MNMWWLDYLPMYTLIRIYTSFGAWWLRVSWSMWKGWKIEGVIPLLLFLKQQCNSVYLGMVWFGSRWFRRNFGRWISWDGGGWFQHWQVSFLLFILIENLVTNSLVRESDETEKEESEVVSTTPTVGAPQLPPSVGWGMVRWLETRPF